VPFKHINRQAKVQHRAQRREPAWPRSNNAVPNCVRFCHLPGLHPPQIARPNQRATCAQRPTAGLERPNADRPYTGQVTSPAVSPLFQVNDLHVSVENNGVKTDILKGLTVTVGTGEVHAIMGPNGSGKSTLANALLGNEEYTIDSGTLLYKGTDITTWETDDRAKSGIFLAFQYPEEIPGVTVINFLRQALSARKGMDLSVLELRLNIREWMARLEMDPAFADRYLNEGFSGGEKKRNEILQMAILEPEFAVLDETDSGLDIDALRIVAKGVQEVRADRPEMGVLLITHYQRLLDYLTPDFVHVLVDGRIVASGGPELAKKLEVDGYDAFR
jgi:Fe-S cluster assembly ATP-binding protein